MRGKNLRSLSTLAAAVAATLAVSRAAAAQEIFTQYFDKPTSTNGAPIGGFYFDAGSNSFWTGGFTGAGQSIRQITVSSGNPSELLYSSGTDTWAPNATFSGANKVGESDWISYARSSSLLNNGTVNAGQGGQPVIGNLKVNTATLTVNGITYNPGQCVVFVDGINVTSPTSPQFSKVVYVYDQRVPTSVNTGRDRNGNGVVEWNDVFDTVATRQDFMDKIATGSNSFNMARSWSFSSDGKSVYINDSAGTMGGLWKVNLESTGSTSLTRMIQITTAPRVNTEPAVIPTSTLDLDPGDPATGDQILVETSSANGDSSDTAAGIGYVIHDLSTNTTSPAKTLVSGAALQAFLEKSTSAIISMTSDAAGNLYFKENQGDGFYMRDTQGRLVKLASGSQFVDYNTAHPGPDSFSSSTLDLQARTVQVTVGSNTFNTTELLFDNGAYDAPIGLITFKPGDFNRDNVVDPTDIASFKSELTVRGVVKTLKADKIYDLNGNDVVDWKDVKVLQQFYAFPDGDADIDTTVDTVDFNLLAANFSSTSATWVQGDFTGDNTVDTVDFNILASNFGLIAPAGIGSVVPEPAAMGLLALAAGGLRRTRRR